MNVKVTCLGKYDLMLASHRNGFFFPAYYFMHKRNIIIDYYIVCYLNISYVMFKIIAFFMRKKKCSPGICGILITRDRIISLRGEFYSIQLV
jgi:hypothetical protein